MGVPTRLIIGDLCTMLAFSGSSNAVNTVMAKMGPTIMRCCSIFATEGTIRTPGGYGPVVGQFTLPAVMDSVTDLLGKLPPAPLTLIDGVDCRGSFRTCCEAMTRAPITEAARLEVNALSAICMCCVYIASDKLITFLDILRTGWEANTPKPGDAVWTNVPLQLKNNWMPEFEREIRSQFLTDGKHTKHLTTVQFNELPLRTATANSAGAGSGKIRMAAATGEVVIRDNSHITLLATTSDEFLIYCANALLVTRYDGRVVDSRSGINDRVMAARAAAASPLGDAADVEFSPFYQEFVNNLPAGATLSPGIVGQRVQPGRDLRLIIPVNANANFIMADAVDAMRHVVEQANPFNGYWANSGTPETLSRLADRTRTWCSMGFDFSAFDTTISSLAGVRYCELALEVANMNGIPADVAMILVPRDATTCFAMTALELGLELEKFITAQPVLLGDGKIRDPMFTFRSGSRMTNAVTSLLTRAWARMFDKRLQRYPWYHTYVREFCFSTLGDDTDLMYLVSDRPGFMRSVAGVLDEILAEMQALTNLRVGLSKSSFSTLRASFLSRGACGGSVELCSVTPMTSLEAAMKIGSVAGTLVTGAANDAERSRLRVGVIIRKAFLTMRGIRHYGKTGPEYLYPPPYATMLSRGLNPLCPLLSPAAIEVTAKAYADVTDLRNACASAMSVAIVTAPPSLAGKVSSMSWSATSYSPATGMSLKTVEATVTQAQAVTNLRRRLNPVRIHRSITAARAASPMLRPGTPAYLAFGLEGEPRRRLESAILSKAASADVGIQLRDELREDLGGYRPALPDYLTIVRGAPQEPYMGPSDYDLCPPHIAMLKRYTLRIPAASILALLEQQLMRQGVAAVDPLLRFAKSIAGHVHFERLAGEAVMIAGGNDPGPLLKYRATLAAGAFTSNPISFTSSLTAGLAPTWVPTHSSVQGVAVLAQGAAVADMVQQMYLGREPGFLLVEAATTAQAVRLDALRSLGLLPSEAATNPID